MDWDDEDEATHIFDKGDEPQAQTPGAPRPSPAAGAPPPAASKPDKSTLLGPDRADGAARRLPPSRTSRPRDRPPPPPPLATSLVASSAPAAGEPSRRLRRSTRSRRLRRTQQGIGGANPFMTAPSRPAASSAHAGAGVAADDDADAAPNPLMGLPAPAPLPQPRAVGARVPSAAPQHGGDGARPPAAEPHGPVGRARRSPASPSIGVAVFLLMPHTGRIVINVTDAKNGAVNRVDIFVDGRKTPCETAPCIVDQVSAGHARGEGAGRRLRRRRRRRPSTVESRKDATATFSLSSRRQGRAASRSTGAQPGVKLYVDDKEIGPLPQELRDLTPGDHTIRVRGLGALPAAREARHRREGQRRRTSGPSRSRSSRARRRSASARRARASSS